MGQINSLDQVIWSLHTRLTLEGTTSVFSGFLCLPRTYIADGNFCTYPHYASDAAVWWWPPHGCEISMHLSFLLNFFYFNIGYSGTYAFILFILPLITRSYLKSCCFKVGIRLIPPPTASSFPTPCFLVRSLTVGVLERMAFYSSLRCGLDNRWNDISYKSVKSASKIARKHYIFVWQKRFFCPLSLIVLAWVIRADDTKLEVALTDWRTEFKTVTSLCITSCTYPDWRFRVSVNFEIPHRDTPTS